MPTEQSKDKMKISHTLPQAERNNFPNLMQQRISLFGRLILIMMSNLNSKTSVKTLLETVKNDLKAHFCKATDEEIEIDMFTSLTFLANDGFIKLSNATKFEDREVIQYFGDGFPEYRSGKFEL